MCKAVKSVIAAVVKAVKKAWNIVRKYIAYIAFFVTLFFPYVWPFISAYLPAGFVMGVNALTAGTFLTMSTLKALAWRAVVGLAAAFLFSSDAAEEIVDKASDVVGGTLRGITEVAGGAVGGVAEGVLSNPWALVAIGVGLFFLLRRSSREDVIVVGDTTRDPPSSESGEYTENYSY